MRKQFTDGGPMAKIPAYRQLYTSLKKEIKEDPHHKGKKQRALDASRRKRYGDVEREISQLEAMISQKEADLSPEIYSDYQKLQEAYEELNQMRQDLEARLEEWADLESELKEGL